MWRAIDGMSKDVQELVQKDAGTEEDEDTEPTPVVEEPALAGTSAIAQPTPEKTVPAQPSSQSLKRMWLVLRIRLLLDCLPMDQWREWKLADRADTQRHHNSNLVEVLWLVMGALKIWEKRHSCQKKEEKGELSLGPMVTSGWKSKDYSAPAEESVSLVGKSTVLPETTSGGLHPTLLGLVR